MLIVEFLLKSLRTECSALLSVLKYDNELRIVFLSEALALEKFVLKVAFGNKLYTCCLNISRQLLSPCVFRWRVVAAVGV